MGRGRKRKDTMRITKKGRQEIKVSRSKGHGRKDEKRLKIEEIGDKEKHN